MCDGNYFWDVRRAPDNFQHQGVITPYFWKWWVFGYFICSVVLFASEKFVYMYTFKNVKNLTGWHNFWEYLEIFKKFFKGFKRLSLHCFLWTISNYFIRKINLNKQKYTLYSLERSLISLCKNCLVSSSTIYLQLITFPLS